MCVGGYNHVPFYGNMAVAMLVFAELRWRRWLFAKKPRRGTAIDKKNDRRLAREGARRGRAGAMRVVAAVRTSWVVRHLRECMRTAT